MRPFLGSPIGNPAWGTFTAALPSKRSEPKAAGKGILFRDEEARPPRKIPFERAPNLVPG